MRTRRGIKKAPPRGRGEESALPGETSEWTAISGANSSPGGDKAVIAPLPLEARETTLRRALREAADGTGAAGWRKPGALAAASRGSPRLERRRSPCRLRSQPRRDDPGLCRTAASPPRPGPRL